MKKKASGGDKANKTKISDGRLVHLIVKATGLESDKVVNMLKLKGKLTKILQEATQEALLDTLHTPEIGLSSNRAEEIYLEAQKNGYEKVRVDALEYLFAMVPGEDKALPYHVKMSHLPGLTISEKRRIVRSALCLVADVTQCLNVVAVAVVGNFIGLVLERAMELAEGRATVKDYCNIYIECGGLSHDRIARRAVRKGLAIAKTREELEMLFSYTDHNSPEEGWVVRALFANASSTAECKEVFSKLSDDSCEEIRDTLEGLYVKRVAEILKAGGE